MEYNVRVCKREDRDYPKLFNRLNGMPERFYYAGDISILNDMTGVAIVGSRKCSEDVLNLAREAGRIAAEADVSIINGLALGCDTESLLGALENGGKCVVVLPGGINKVYPKCNEGLMLEIIEKGGCVVSEYAPDADPKKFTFIDRDRLQSALSLGVLVIAAEMRSGTMRTVRAAVKQRRMLSVYSPKIVDLEGNIYITEKGATEISGVNDLKSFYEMVKEEGSYEQMSLFDDI